MPLSDVKIRTVKPSSRPMKLSDGGGLHLRVTPAGGKLWRLAYRHLGKQKELALGAYPEIGLAEARAARDDAKRLLALGKDPGEAKKMAQRTALREATNTFSMVADELLAKMERDGRARATLAKTRWLLDFARPFIGARPISQITAPEVLEVLQRVEKRGRYESARRLRSTIGTVFRFAVATARADNDPTFALRGALTAPRVQHRAAITKADGLGPLLRAIDTFDGQPVTRAALQLMALLFPRPGELRMARWSEFDLDRAVWEIPAERTKTRRPHQVPLPQQAIALLRALQPIAAIGVGRLVLPGVRTVLRPMSDNTLNAALRRLGYAKDEATAHGFRATASSLLNESGLWSVDAIERQLAHVESNDVRRAYQRAEHWDERVRMMQWWADYLDRLRIAPSLKKSARC
ncbi:tyrosine-type recombinase/integrase [Roseococcus sp.]|uniref:tyrosine-type recombinase/integrase n=1 Tax=Roseococcus sp. TaxID=2109646 RepID=UPI003BAD8DCC